MDLERTGNLIEAGLWGTIAAVMAVRALFENPEIRRLFVLLAIAFAAFGLSDVVESRTGAWWRPWWLFVWKAGCVLTFILGFWRYYLLRRR